MIFCVDGRHSNSLCRRMMWYLFMSMEGAMFFCRILCEQRCWKLCVGEIEIVLVSKNMQ